jgi:hypothetical protein
LSPGAQREYVQVLHLFTRNVAQRLATRIESKEPPTYIGNAFRFVVERV